MPSHPPDSPPDLPQLQVWVVLHLFYPDLVEELLRYLDNIPNNYRLLVTIPIAQETSAISDADRDQLQARAATVLPCPNRGFDVGGLITVLNQFRFPENDIICKVHTKRDPRWRRKSLDPLLGTPRQVERILSLFAANPRLGMIGSRRTRLRLDAVNIGSNRKQYQELLTRLKIPLERAFQPFFAGTMFWIRGAILNYLGSAGFTSEEFEDVRIEPSFDPNAEFNPPADFQAGHWLKRQEYQFQGGAIYHRQTGIAYDGQKAHAFERVFCDVAAHLGYDCQGL